jgi:NADH-quinone oxidoreductase subunit J
MFHLILFLFFGAICVAGAVNLLVQSHPINSALSLIVVMASLAVEYLLLGAEFVAAVQVIVYAGAIMVLFVITIMLLNAGKEERTKGSRVAILLGVPGVLIGGVLVAWTLLLSLQHARGGGHRSAARRSADIARLLFHDFLLPFEVTSVLILIAIMGAVVLASRPEAVARGPEKGLVAPGKEMVPLSYYLVLSGILFVCGVLGFLIKRNIITIFMSIELMLNGVNLSFVAFAAHWHALERAGLRLLRDGGGRR